MTGGKCGENVTWLLSGDTLIISGQGEMKNYHCGVRSRKAPAPWFDLNAAIKKIIINNGVTTIGNSAFFNCMITDVKLPDSLTKIGESAFYYCWNLTGVDIPNGVKKIEASAFGGCHSFSWVTIPDSVVDIGAWAFSSCEGLRVVTIPASVKNIGEWIFAACFLKEIHYPEGRGFEKNLSAGNNAQLIPYKNAPQPVSKPKPQPAAEEMQATVVKQAEQIREKLLPLWWEEHRRLFADKLRWKVEGKTLTVGGVSEIKAYSYEETPWRDSLNDIQRIIIGDGVEKISARAFIECRRLELLTIPASVKTIGDMAFSFCYCGDWRANGGKNVYWTLEDGVLNLKKYPTVRGDADFSTGAVSWLALDKNITGIKLEEGVLPKEKFFEWLTKRGNAMQIAFG
ncbi:MAG: leucine-rich repeat domain-containing protein [Quinella sp. 1Q5]|nr:leucine-rich repeat domain-containing protein [Quinella sp. 1Q5]